MVHTMKTVAGITGARRRQHEKAFKMELVEQCLAPGASVAAVALAGGINANMLFKWRREHLRSEQLNRPASLASSVLVPVHVAADLGADADHSRSSAPLQASIALAVVPHRGAGNAGVIEVDFAGAVLRLRGPLDEASLRAVLRALRHSA